MILKSVQALSDVGVWCRGDGRRYAPTSRTHTPSNRSAAGSGNVRSHCVDCNGPAETERQVLRGTGESLAKEQYK